MKIIIVNGMPESGKTTFEQICTQFCEEFGIDIEILSTITPIKILAEKIGWDGRKTPKDRKFLSDLKDLCTNYSDYSINWIKSEINKFPNYPKEKNKIIIFIDTREPEEIERLKSEWNAKTLLIRRSSVENNKQSNHADANVLEYDYDYAIYNNGTIDKLQKIAKNFMIRILSEGWESKIE